MTDIYRTHVQDHGRVVIPAAIRSTLGLRPGDEVVIEARDQTVLISPLNAAVTRFQDLVCEHVPAEVRLADELIAERRAEAAGE
jgi:AbrB family looped-hinge helix DNA binding protein